MWNRIDDDNGEFECILIECFLFTKIIVDDDDDDDDDDNDNEEEDGKKKAYIVISC